MYSIIYTTSISDSSHKVGTPSTITPTNFVLLFFLTILLLFDFYCGLLLSFFWHIKVLSSTSSISAGSTIACSVDELPMKPASNWTIVTSWASDGRPIFILTLLFLSKTDSPFLWSGQLPYLPYGLKVADERK